jgi:hypothetical protein
VTGRTIERNPTVTDILHTDTDTDTGPRAAGVSFHRPGPPGRLGRTGLVLTVVLAVVAALVAAGVVLGLASPATADLTGRWAMTVTIHSQDPPQVVALTCDFGADHHLRCLNVPGTAPLEGNGVWNSADGGRFGFWITHHAQLDAQGRPTGSIYAEHLGRLEGGRFTTHGLTFVDMHDGSPWMGPVAVEAVADRIR